MISFFKSGLAVTVASAALIGPLFLAAPAIAKASDGISAASVPALTSSYSPVLPGEFETAQASGNAAETPSNVPSPGATTPTARTGVDPNSPAMTGTSLTPQGTSPSKAAPAGPQAAAAAHHDARTEARIKSLHDQLHITSAETPAWDNLAQQMRADEQQVGSAYNQRGSKANMNAVEDLQSYAMVAQARADSMKNLIPAFQTLYGQLSPTQQKTADALFEHSRHPVHAAAAKSTSKSSTSKATTATTHS